MTFSRSRASALSPTCAVSARGHHESGLRDHRDQQDARRSGDGPSAAAVLHGVDDAAEHERGDEPHRCLGDEGGRHEQGESALRTDQGECGAAGPCGARRGEQFTDGIAHAKTTSR